MGKTFKLGVFKLFAALVMLTAPLATLTGTSYADGSVSWTGQGSDSVKACTGDQTPYLHWIFTTGGNSSVDSATLSVSGSASGGGAMSEHGGSWTLNTTYTGTGQPTTNTLSASVAYTGDLGRGQPNLVISDGCFGEGGQGGGGTDLCVNIEGVQTEVPSGMVRDEQGNCTTPNNGGTDICVNIEGVQTEIPSGMVKDEQGNCVTPGQGGGDVCVNIEGVQTEVPSGMTRDENGNCTTTTTTTTGGTPQVLAASTTNQVAVVPTGSVNGGLGTASKTLNHVSLAGLIGALLSLSSGLVMLNRRQS